jgi:RNA polymerase sigma-70 factor, ECF subfamily
MRIFQRTAPSEIASPAGFSKLFERERLPVFRYIYGLTGGPGEVVEDLTAETFLRAWKGRHRFEGDEPSAIGWLIQIAKRLVIDDYRRQVVQDNHQAALLPEFEAGLEQVVMDDERWQTLLLLLDELPAETREILVLRYLLEWRVQEIARHIGSTENNVSVTIHRALARIRTGWQDCETRSTQAVNHAGVNRTETT